jgi:hypothetical protein
VYLHADGSEWLCPSSDSRFFSVLPTLWKAREKETNFYDRNSVLCRGKLRICREIEKSQTMSKYLLMLAVRYRSIGLLNTRVTVIMYEPMRVTSFSKILDPVCQQSKCSDVFFASVASVHCHTLPPISFHSTCQNETRDTFPDIPVPNKSILSRLMNRDTQLFTGLHQTWGKHWTLRRNAADTSDV